MLITSVKNPTAKALKGLRDKKERESTGRMLVEGEVMIREALGCGLKIHDCLTDENRAELASYLRTFGANVFETSEGVLTAVCDTKTPQGVCASFDMPKPIGIEQMPNRIVALDGVQDPGNVGTIWRTADAAGFQSVLFGAGCADAFSPKVMRSAMGSGFRVPVSFTDNLAETLGMLARNGYTVIASDLKGEDFYHRPAVGEKMVLIIGSEAHGISQAVRDSATMRVKLPMRGGAESLNAAIAAGIMMYELMRE